MDFPAKPLRRRVAEAAESLSEVLTSVRVACHAGARPKRMPVRMEIAPAKAKMRRSKRVLSGVGSQEEESRCGMMLRPRYPRAKPARPPVLERSRLSVRTWRRTLERLA